MSSSLDAIKRVVDAFERSDWTEIDVRAGDLRVHLASGAVTVGSPAPSATTRPTPAEAAAADDEPTALAPTADVPAGAHVVTAPSPGIFWRSPEPGAPHFADVGDAVDASSTLCIIEVMKLMSHLKAGVAGEVAAVYGRNGVAVEQGEALFAIVPAEPAS